MKNSRKYFLLTCIAISFAFALQAQLLKDWGAGELVQIKKKGTLYYYAIATESDRFVGRSPRKLKLVENSTVKFSISGDSLYVVDKDGKTQRTRYYMQELLPPPPPPYTRAQ